MQKGYFFCIYCFLVINAHSSLWASTRGKQIVQYEIQRAATRIPLQFVKVKVNRNGIASYLYYLQEHYSRNGSAIPSNIYLHFLPNNLCSLFKTILFQEVVGCLILQSCLTSTDAKPWNFLFSARKCYSFHARVDYFYP